jgi:hypothetical protein
LIVALNSGTIAERGTDITVFLFFSTSILKNMCEIETARDFKKLKASIREYLQDTVQPLILTNYSGYIDIYPLLYDIRSAMLKADRELLMNTYINLRKKIQSYEHMEKN